MTLHALVLNVATHYKAEYTIKPRLGETIYNNAQWDDIDSATKESNILSAVVDGTNKTSHFVTKWFIVLE